MTPCPEYTPDVLKPPYFYQYLIGIAFLRHFKLDEINAFCEYTLDHRGPTVKWTCTRYSHSTCAILTLSHMSLKYSSWAPSVSFFFFLLGDRYFRTYRLIVSMATRHARHVTQRTQPHSSVWHVDHFFFISFIFLFKIFTNMLTILWNIWYSDSEICASKCIW